MNLRQPELTPQQLADWLGHCPDRLAELVSISPHGRRQVKAFASGTAVMTRYDKDQLIRAMRLSRHQCVACPQGDACHACPHAGAGVCCGGAV